MAAGPVFPVELGDLRYSPTWLGPASRRMLRASSRSPAAASRAAAPHVIFPFPIRRHRHRNATASAAPPLRAVAGRRRAHPRSAAARAESAELPWPRESPAARPAGCSPAGNAATPAAPPRALAMAAAAQDEEEGRGRGAASPPPRAPPGPCSSASARPAAPLLLRPLKCQCMHLAHGGRCMAQLFTPLLLADFPLHIDLTLSHSRTSMQQS